MRRPSKQKQARSAEIEDGRKRSRNMSRYPIVLKDYGFPSYFAPGFRYNEQALVYSGLLADRGIPAALAGENAAFQPEDRP